MRLDRATDSRKAPQRWTAPLAPSASGEGGRWTILGVSLVGALFLATMTLLFVLEVQRYREAEARLQGNLRQLGIGSNGVPRSMYESLLPYIESPSPYTTPWNGSGPVRTFIAPTDGPSAGA